MAKGSFVQRLKPSARLGLIVAAAALGLALAAPSVLAQGFGFGQPGGMFDSFFSPFSPPRSSRPMEQRPAADFTRAPLPRKLDTHPNDNVLVLGDSMADWLAYGLEDALGATRATRRRTGLTSRAKPLPRPSRSSW
ncbi:MAG: hypothetical protein J0H89_09100 [Rhizobiales bacterium]|nr:hypothetical protein [Hyphomicrobiales bacterium]